MNVIKIANNLDEHLIRYTVSYACNFNCKDCYQENKRLHNNYKVSKELINRISKKINDLIESVPNDGKPITLYPEGGEVSLLGDKLLNIINILSSNNSYKYTFNITTNLSYSYEYYKSLIDIAAYNDRITKFVILGSYHSEFTNKETYSNKLIKLKQYVDDNYFNNIILRSSIVIRTDNFEEVKWLSTKLSQVDVYQSIRRQLKDDKTVISYPTEISEWINNHDKDYLQIGVRTTKGEIKKISIKLY